MQSSMTPISTPSPEAMYKKYTDLSTLHDPRVDAVLKRAAMGGDPNYPQVYAIMAIQARTAAKGQAQQMQGAQGAQGPQASVAEKVIAKAAPHPMEQGVASLPVDPNTFHAAGGGMVSFADRGLVEGETPYVPNDPRYEADSVPGAFLFDSQDEDAAKLKRSNTRSAKAASAKASPDEAPDASTSGKKPDGGSDNKGFPPLPPEEKKRIRALSGPKEETKKDIKKGADKGITALKTNVPQAEKDIAAETAARYHKMVGEDPDAVDRKARMEALGLSNAEAKRQAPWMALANAGFGMMAGPSQFAMQNIGAGAQQGLASLTEQQKDMVRAQERHAAMQDAIGERDYARRAKGAELGMTTEAAAKLAAARNEEQRRDIVSRERVAGITALGMSGRLHIQETGIMLRGLDKALVAANNELILATTKKEKDAIKARIANLTTQMNQYLNMSDMQTAGAPVGGSLVTDKSGMMNYTPAS